MATPEQRLFFALWPPESVRAGLAEITAGVPRSHGRPPHRDDLHVTLVFLGGVAPERLACVERAASGARGEPFDLVLDRLGYWSRPRIAWCGPSVTPEPLVQLVTDLQARLGACGFQPERRRYAAHVTLLRHARAQPAGELDVPITWPVRDFVLVASEPGGPPPRYRVLRRWSLGSS